MSKPTDLVRFAVDGSDANASNISAPSPGTRDTGFPTNAILTSGNLNYFLNGYYRWLQYLNAGAFSGASSFDSTLNVTGVLTTATDAALAGNTTVGGQLYNFTNFTFTADSTTDTCTATAHPLHTGLGPIRTSNSGGGLPGGLAAGTDYFAINTGANTFKLATSQANAIAGVAIDITSNGTGTQTLNHQSTTTRISDVTVTRNLVVGGNVNVTGNIRRATFKRTFWPNLINSASWSEGSIGVGGGAVGAVTSAAISAEPRGYFSTASGGARFAIPFEDGDRITGLSIEIRGDGVHGSSLEVDWLANMAGTGGGSGTPIGSWTVATHASGFNVNVAGGPFVPTQLSAGNMLYVWLSATGAGLGFGPVVATFDRPL